MPGMYEVNQPMKIAEVGDSIFIAESEKTPMSRLLKRGKKPSQMLSEWGCQKYPSRGFGGTVDGTDISEYDHTTREKLEAYGMWLMSKGWMVSKLAQVTQTAGVKDEQAKQAKDDSLMHAQMHERQILSDMDTQAEGDGKPYQSRGVFSWLQNAAQANKPVPAIFRPAAGCIFSAALATFLPANMETMLEAAATAKRGPVDLTGFVGIKLKSQMSTWPQRQFGDANAAKAMQCYNLEASEKKFMQVVDFFEFDAGKVNVIPSWYLMCDSATGEDTAYTPRSGAFLDLSMWELDFLENPSSYIESPKSGGPRGYHSSIYILKCLNPLGQCMVKSNT